MREYFEECENPETCGESFGEKWERLRKQLRTSIVWENRKDKIPPSIPIKALEQLSFKAFLF